MLGDFWASASTVYKTVVLSALGFMVVGLGLNIIGLVKHNNPLAIGALPVIGVGLLLHVVGMVIRTRELRKGGPGK
ncbi:uncharacterized protein involved in response to NO [Arthrobacter woluwensis]|uniref:DUF3188 domain-containing protein n=1 Tax=Arthrobacter woluwensis TaxID=156980 RepID=UPI002784B0FA|nr:DUF3188 domain-containing protein [Arthrobacter woluwensis]MDQ0709732.1 uncharacterized protein involved in response to NO [Arthrobacter woluwensis]